MNKVSRAALIRNMNGKDIVCEVIEGFQTVEQMKQQLEQTVKSHNEKNPQYQVNLIENEDSFEFAEKESGRATGQFILKSKLPQFRYGRISFRSNDAIFNYALESGETKTSFINSLKDIQVVSESEFRLSIHGGKVLSYRLV